MATPRRQPRSTTESEALRAKRAAMTYSFAQQIPQLSSHAPPPPPPQRSQRSTPDDPNFPKLTSNSGHIHRSRTTQNPPRAWDTAKRPTTPGRPPRWANGSGKPATAAEVVASVPADASAQGEDAVQSEKHEAELALYSKLVPTTSAVPRNPGSLLGGGGLRATGSVAVQKSSRSTAGPPIHSPQPLTLPSRREPMVSRMRNLSSEASRPHLARRVARLNRSASATPPPALSVPSSASSNASVDGMESETTIDDELEKAGSVSLGPIPRKEDLSHLRNMSREDSPQNSTVHGMKFATQRSHGDSHESRMMPFPSRRLDEAFLSRNRSEPGTVAGTPNVTKHSMNTPHHSSALSPPPGLRKGSTKDGRNSNWTSKEPTESNVPPGFESRSAAKSAFNRARNIRSDAESTQTLKQLNRGNSPVRPQNARADALREALNSRRRAASPRVPRGSRMQGQGAGEGNGHASEPYTGAHNRMRRYPERQTLRTRVIEDDSKRLTQSALSDGPNPDLNGFSASRSRRSSAGNREQRRDHLNHRRDSVMSAPGIQRRLKPNPADLGREQHPMQTNYSPTPLSSAETKGFESSEMGLCGNGTKEGIQSGFSQLCGGSRETMLPAVPEFHVQYPGGHLEGRHDQPKSHELRNDWRGIINKVSVSDRESRASEDNLFKRDPRTDRAFQSPSFKDGEQKVSSSGLSMVGIVNGFCENGVEPIAHHHLHHVEGTDDVLLPPLPNSEDVGFESMLRSMGWTPLDEEEGPRHHHSHSARQAKYSATTERFGGDLAMQDSRDGSRKTENRGSTNGYYSHFH